MHFRTNAVQPVTVKFLAQDEEQEITLKVNCMTPQKVTALGRKIAVYEAQAQTVKCHEALADVIVGWEGDMYEDDVMLTFSKKSMVQLFNNHIGLSDAVANQIISRYNEQRLKNSGSLAEDSQSQAEKQAK